jgi:hypothetical protein
VKEQKKETIFFVYNSQCPSRLTGRVRRSYHAEKLKLGSDGGDSGSKKCRRGYGGAYGEVLRSLRLAGARSQAVGFVLVPLHKIKAFLDHMNN